MPYYIPYSAVQNIPLFIHYSIHNTTNTGIPSLETLYELYKSNYYTLRNNKKTKNKSKNVGIFPELKSSSWIFFICLNLFRMASIVSGVYSRMLQGNASQGGGKRHSALSKSKPSKNSTTTTTTATTETYLETFREMPNILMSIAIDLIKPFHTSNKIMSDTIINTRNQILREQFHITSTDVVSSLALEILNRLREFNDKYVIPVEHRMIQYYMNSNSNSLCINRKIYQNKAKLSPEFWPNGRGLKWEVSTEFKNLQQLAKESKLWNMWMTTEFTLPLISAHSNWKWNEIIPHFDKVSKVCLSNVEYAYVGIETGRCILTPYIVNCSAPDTGNMEIIGRIGSIEQRNMYLESLLLGKTKSCFAMTEPNIPSSDPTQLSATAVVNEGGWIVNGRKWWTSNALHPDCNCCLFIANTPSASNNSKHKQHSLFIFPFSLNGITIVRPLDVFGFDDPPHGHAEVLFEQVQIPNQLQNIQNILVNINPLVGELGSGFEYAQLRLGPGRLHHMSRLIGHCQRALEHVIALYHGDKTSGTKRIAFGKSLVELGGNPQSLGECYVAYNAAKLCVIQAAYALDEQAVSVQKQTKSHQLTRKAIESLSIAKVITPQAASKCIDLAIQLYGGGGLSTDHPLSGMWIAARTLRIADGPGNIIELFHLCNTNIDCVICENIDEVHLQTIAKLILKSSNSATVNTIDLLSNNKSTKSKL